MAVETAEAKKTEDFQLSDLDEDVDIDVMTEVQQKSEPLQLADQKEEESKDTPPKTQPSPKTEEVADDERPASWSGFLKKKLGSFKGEPTEKTGAAETKKRDWSKEQEALAKLKTSAVTTLNQMGTRFNEGSAYLYEASKRTAHATAENLRKIRLFKTPIEAVCRNEAAQKPCSRLLLICCTAIAQCGLPKEDIFKQDVPEELIHAVSVHFVRENGAVLPPSGATPAVLLGVVKKFLIEMDEPLLTYKLVDDWIESGKHPPTAKDVMLQLPAANRHSFDVLLDCLNRVASFSNKESIEADELAEDMAPYVLWRLVKPPVRKNLKSTGNFSRMFMNKQQQSLHEEREMEESAPKGPSSVTDESFHERSDNSDKQGRIPLEGEELRNLIRALTYLIFNAKMS